MSNIRDVSECAVSLIEPFLCCATLRCFGFANVINNGAGSLAACGVCTLVPYPLVQIYSSSLFPERTVAGYSAASLWKDTLPTTVTNMDVIIKNHQ
jgi:hypothetical protein